MKYLIQTPVTQRREIFLKAASIFKRRLPEFVEVEAHETVSTKGWSGFDISLAIESIEEVAAVCTAALRGEIATTASSQRACELMKLYSDLCASLTSEHITDSHLTDSIFFRRHREVQFWSRIGNRSLERSRHSIST